MAQERTELEIKLVGAPVDIAALRRSKIVAAHRTGRASNERLASTYYDTRDESLRNAGVSLRLREEAGRRVQTVKRESGAGAALVRTEDERTLALGESFPALGGVSIGAELIAGADDLQPVVRTVSDRWAVELSKRDTRIEFAFDIGRLEARRDGAATHMGPLAEAELELLEGDPGVLFDLARDLVGEARGRLRINLLAKAEQARRLVDPAPALSAEGALDLDPQGDAGAAFAATLTAIAARIVYVAPAIIGLRLPEGVHQMRVALRRLRAVERIYRPALGGRSVRALARRAKEIQKGLGAARDWDVFLDATLPPLIEGANLDDGFAALEARANALRAKAWRPAAKRISSADFSVFALDLLESAYCAPWRAASPGLSENVEAFAARALDERRAAALACAAAIEDPDPAAQHPLRIALKKLRYAAQAFRALYPRDERKPFMAAMSQLQDGLGAVNDAVVAQRLANEAALGQGKDAARAAGFVCGYSASEAAAAAREIGESWKSFEAMAPFWRSTR